MKRRLVLTEAGAAYARQVRESLDRLECDAMGGRALTEAHSSLSLAALPSFSTRWLIPRLPSFSRCAPDVSVDIAGRVAPFDFSGSRFDAAIHFGAASWPGAVTEFLFDEELVPVCAARLMEGRSKLDPAELAHLPLLHQASRQSSWAKRFSQVGVNGINAMRGPRYEMSDMLLQAAVAGLGVALAPRFLVQEDLACGHLRVPCGIPLRCEAAYYFVYPEARWASRPVQAFAAWLLATASRERGLHWAEVPEEHSIQQVSRRMARRRRRERDAPGPCGPGAAFLSVARRGGRAGIDFRQSSTAP